LSTRAVYHLSPGVRVRKEDFGLLFYNSRNTNLTFVKSGDWLEIACGPPEDDRLTVHAASSAEEARVERLIEALKRKGLVVEKGTSL
jgi:putative mycofactocin binding protein MftB